MHSDSLEGSVQGSEVQLVHYKIAQLGANPSSAVEGSAVDCRSVQGRPVQCSAVQFRAVQWSAVQ